MMLKSKKMMVRNLPKDGILRDKVTNKPYPILVSLFVISLLLLKSLPLVAVVILCLSLYLLFSKERRLIEFYDDYVIFFTDLNNEECYILYTDEILDWRIESCRKLLSLQVTLINNKVVTLSCGSKHKLLKYFKQNIPNKNSASQI